MEAGPRTGQDTNSQGTEGFKGAFSTQADGVVGFGATKRKIRQTITVYAEEQGDGTFRVNLLNKNYIPSGKARIITRDELLRDFLPEPDLYLNKVAPMPTWARPWPRLIPARCFVS